MKYSSSWLAAAETALYFGAALLIPRLNEYFPAMLVFLGLTAVCMFIAEMLQKSAVLRTLIMLPPAAAVLLCPIALELIIFIPPFVYALLTAATGRFQREHWRYLRVVRFLFGIAALLLIISFANEPTLPKPIILTGIFFLFDVVGLRKLRTGISGSPSWRFFNFAEVFLPLSAVGLTVAGLVILIERAKKLLEYLMMPLAYLLTWITNLMAWLFSHTRMASEISETGDAMLETTAAATRPAAVGTKAPDIVHYANLPEIEINWRIVLAALFILAAGLALVLFFRNKPESRKKPDGGITGGTAFRTVRKRKRREHSESSVERIRICYRRYLDMLYVRGLRRSPGDTSLDILHFAEDGVQDENEVRLRELYLKARYLGKAEKAEAKEAENILEILKKS